MRRAATSGSPKFFLGTDSAPHARDAKESGCGCAGIFNAPFALEAYATVFDEEGALDRLEAFASENGPRFYGLPLNDGTVTLRAKRRPGAGDDRRRRRPVIPFLAGSIAGLDARLDQPQPALPPVPLAPITPAKCPSTAV